MTLSLLFAGSTCGFGIGTIVVERILNFLGQFNYKQPRNTLLPASPLLAKLRGNILSKEDIGSSVSQARFLVLIIGCVLHSTHFVLMGIRKGFGSMFLAYAIAAFARALWTAENAYFALGPKQSLGYSYGLWSFGGVVSPLICQAITSKKVPWSHFYFGSLVLSVLNLAFLVLTFRPTDTELNHERREAAAKTTKPLTEDYFSAISSTVEDPFAPSSPTSTERSPNNSTLRLAIAMPLVWALSICSMLYSGTLMVTFLLQARHADPNGAGYVTSGFWGGITVGRFIWGFLTPRLTYTQRKILVQVTLAVALTMHLLIWFTKSIFGNALCASIIGLLYGPVFPAFLSMATDILPTDVHLVSMAIIALLPFIAGTILGVKGAQTLTYFTVASGIVLTCLWAILPSRIPADQMRDKN
ncbi:hypothetical protein AMATHDRAFT_77416 [Amanita thiersii Skay4041]|uniref:Major facilitator superfamily (MFS) profile domain-containing protein n=1 Tax=Amanita thiersii Skay4041 TaxID=703135 RepID=A0A2A9N903_9AGAR|nr:hypothetical protein AMATHDRAFT_77416 [Amanita thiersii Skay4041]